MSRRIVQLPDHEKFDYAVVGWDQPMMSFFAACIKPGNPFGEDEPDEVIGYWSRYEIYDLEDFERALDIKGIKLPTETWNDLYLDRDLGR